MFQVSVLCAIVLLADAVPMVEDKEDTEIYRAINEINEEVTYQNNSDTSSLVKNHFQDITNSITSDGSDVDEDVGMKTIETPGHEQSKLHYTVTTAPIADFDNQGHDVDSKRREDPTKKPILGSDKSIREADARQWNDPATSPTVDVDKATHEAETIQQTDPTKAPVEDFTNRGHEADSRQRNDPVAATTQIPKMPLDPTDTYLLDGILDIVDAKFETLNKRLMALERGISNVQYYNVRSFRVVNTHLHAVDTILHSLHTGMVQAEQRNSQLNQKVAEINHDVENLASTNSRMVQALEENMSFYLSGIQTEIYVLMRSFDQTNENLEEMKNDTRDIKAMVLESNKSQSEMLVNSETFVRGTREVMQAAYHVLNETLEIKDKTGEIENHSFRVSKTIEEVARKVSVLTKDADEIKTIVNVILANITNSNNNNPKHSITKFANIVEIVDNTTETEDDPALHMTCSTVLKLIDELLKNVNASIATNLQKIDNAYESEMNDFFQTESQKLLRGIEQVNQNVLQSMTRYNHTGNLIERILSDTETIARDQINLRDDILGYSLNTTFELFNRSLPEFVTFGGRDKKVTTSPIESDGIYANPFLHELSLLIRNGSQLFELMTEMVAASSSTVKLSLDNFNSEVSKLANVRDEITGNMALVRNTSEINNIYQLAEIRNTTDYILMLADAIASNTGWIPYVYHRVKYVESQVNRTLDIVNKLDSRTEETLLIQKANMAFIFKPFKSTTSDERTEGRHTFGPPKTTTKAPDIETTYSDPMAYTKGTQQPEKSGIINAARNQSLDSTIHEMIEFVYRTNKKVDRLIPALTHLLGEPEPLIVLLDGNSDKEGRVEIYHKGEWGTIPRNIDHIEASYICRKLGYFGGVSVGSGSFGCGSGAFWDLNVTCLRTRWCDSVSHVADPSAYSHEMDAGVMCDHMIRLTKSNEEDETELSQQSGSLEIYHQNNWLPVCFKNWGREETEVVCKQLGFREGAASSEKDGTLIDSYSMTNVMCTGSENRLDACAFAGFKLNGCPSSEYVSVQCI